MTDMVQAEATELNPEKTHDSRLSIGQQQATIPSMPDGERKQRRVAGAMTGTSLDGIDTALVSIDDGEAGAARQPALRRDRGTAPRRRDTDTDVGGDLRGAGA
jgi:hypothetical protein